MNGCRKRLTRRSVVAAGFALAGCVRFAADEEANSTEGGNSDPESTGGEGDDPDTTDSTQDGDDGSQSGDSTYADHMDGANGWDGSLVDLRGQREVVVQNGAGEDTFTFDPAGIRVDPGTTVVWEWVSDGHTVTHTNGDAFDTEVANEGFTFEYTFGETGTYNYHCTPHRSLGQRGTVVVGGGSTDDTADGELDEETRETLLSIASEYYENLSDGGFDAAVDLLHPEGPVFSDYYSGDPGVTDWYQNVEYVVDSTEVVDWATETAEVAVTLIVTADGEEVQESGRVTLEQADGQFLVWDDTLIDVVLEYASATGDDGDTDSDTASPGDIVTNYVNALDDGAMGDAIDLVHSDSPLYSSWSDVEANAEWYVATDIDVDIVEVLTGTDSATVNAEITFDEDSEVYAFEVAKAAGAWRVWEDPTTDVPPSSS